MPAVVLGHDTSPQEPLRHRNQDNDNSSCQATSSVNSGSPSHGQSQRQACAAPSQGARGGDRPASALPCSSAPHNSSRAHGDRKGWTRAQVHMLHLREQFTSSHRSVRGRFQQRPSPAWAAWASRPCVPRPSAPRPRATPSSPRWSTRCSHGSRAPALGWDANPCAPPRPPASLSTSLGLSFPRTPGLMAHSRKHRRPALPVGPGRKEPPAAGPAPKGAGTRSPRAPERSGPGVAWGQPGAVVSEAAAG